MINSRKFILNPIQLKLCAKSKAHCPNNIALLTFNDLDWLAIWRCIDLWMLLLPTGIVEVSWWTTILTSSVRSECLSFAALSILGLLLHRTWWILGLQWPITLHAARFHEVSSLRSWGLRRSERWFFALGRVVVIISTVLKWRAYLLSFEFAILHVWMVIEIKPGVALVICKRRRDTNRFLFCLFKILCFKIKRSNQK